MSAPRIRVFVGPGGVGKTSLAAGYALARAHAGSRVLVQTFDPSWRLKDALGMGEERTTVDVELPVSAHRDGRLTASLLDVRRTFDEVVARYSPSVEDRDRILEHRFYRGLAGDLAGVLEYMAVERLYDLQESGRFDELVLDTPPARQAFDLFEAPRRIVDFLDSGAAQLGARPWFDGRGRLILPAGLALVRGRVEEFLDSTFGLDFLRELADFFAAFTPLYGGFRDRAEAVDRLLRSERTRFLLVIGPRAERLAEASFFARRLEQRGLHLAGVAINRLRPRIPAPRRGAAQGWRILHRAGERDFHGAALLEASLGGLPVVRIAEEPGASGDLEAFRRLGEPLHPLF